VNILVVNIGSTSFKFRLIDMAGERVLVRGAVEGVGKPEAQTTLTLADGEPETSAPPMADQAAAVQWCVAVLRDAGLGFEAVGFKAVHGGEIEGAALVNEEVLATMERFREAAPAHNPPYIAAMRAFQQQRPELPLVAAFETGFHQTIPAARTTYAVPSEWTQQYGVRRYGFHGASHRYIAVRTAELLGRDELKIISCHLGGSSSLCAIENGQSVANSFGMTPQAGLPQNNRVGDFDPYALLTVKARSGLEWEAMLQVLSRQGGLLGISGLSNDMRALLEAGEAGNSQAALAVDVYVESIRHYIGAYLVALGGLDALVFTGGIGERSAAIRERVCRGLEFLGIELEAAANQSAVPDVTVSISRSPVSVLAIQTNEELIVARQAQALLVGSSQVTS
jgi:acetate kinase